jgi:hypothetical protein
MIRDIPKGVWCKSLVINVKSTLFASMFPLLDYSGTVLKRAITISNKANFCLPFERKVVPKAASD